MRRSLVDRLESAIRETEYRREYALRHGLSTSEWDRILEGLRRDLRAGR